MQLLHWATAYFAGLSSVHNPISENKSIEREAKIAVIGSGITASAFLSEFLELEPSAQVTVFERDAIVGGRMISAVHRYGEFQALEGGASHFGTDDKCLTDLLHKYGLKHGAEIPSSQLPEGYGFAHRSTPQTSVRCDIQSTEWRRTRDLTWSYGLSFWRARRLIQSVVSKWQAFLNDTRGNLSDALFEADMDHDLFGPATSLFEQYGISPAFQREVLQPCAKSHAYKSVGEDTALSALLNARQTTRTAVVGGNAQVAERIFEQTHVNLLLGTEVVRIATGTSRQYNIRHRPTNRDAEYEESEFDIVILATPIASSNILLDLPNDSPISGLASGYEPRHVTYVAARQQLSSAQQFEYLDVHQLRDHVSTSSDFDQHEIDAIGMRLKCGIHPCQDECDDCGYENIYRIVSRSRLDDTTLIDLIEPIPGSLVDKARRAGTGVNFTLADHGISWIHRYALPNALPKWQTDRDRPKSVEIAPGLFYTAILEHAVSSLEMGCKMGRYTAGKVAQCLQSTFKRGRRREIHDS